MNGKLVVLDTNIVLYILGNKYDIESIPEGQYCVSVISEMELLAYSDLSIEEENKIKEFLCEIDIMGLSSIIKQNAIEFRKKYKLKLPDAIIAATAVSLNAKLVTNDQKLNTIFEII